MVVTDDVEGGRIATGHLLALGHERIAFIGDDPANPFGFTASPDRERGYREVLGAAGIPVRPELVRYGPHDRTVAQRLTEQLLARRDRPTAVFASSDVQATGVLAAARAAGLRVPDDLSVVGFDDIEISAYAGLTTVRQPLFESGRIGAELLLAALDRDEATPSDEPCGSSRSSSSSGRRPDHPRDDATDRRQEGANGRNRSRRRLEGLFRRHRSRPRARPRDRGQGVHGPRRAVRVRQDHRAAHGRRPGGDLTRHDLDRRPRRQRPAAEGARHRDGVPELRAVPAHDRVRQHGLRAEAPDGCRSSEIDGTGERRGAHPRPRRAARAASPRRSPAASGSASRWAAPSCATRRRS